MTYTAKYKSFTFTGDSIADIGEQWQRYVISENFGYRDMRSQPRLYRDGKQIGWLSYNGRAWPTKMKQWTPQSVELTA
jgi:hypothetical protein